MSGGLVLLICLIGGNQDALISMRENALEARLFMYLKIGVFEHLKPGKCISSHRDRVILYF